MTDSASDQLLQALRERLLEGHYAAEEKLTEQSLASDLGVSRTLVRLALAGLEHEGLVTRAPNRGFRVRAFTLEEVADAIAVRGELEAMAARLAAENGVSKSDRVDLESQLDAMDALLSKGLQALEHRARWIELNGAFHASLLNLAGNSALVSAVEDLGKMPLVSSRAIVFDPFDATDTHKRIERAHLDHHNVIAAIISRQGSRAAAIMREHAAQSRANKQSSFSAILERQPEPALPGLRLVSHNFDKPD